MEVVDLPHQGGLGQHPGRLLEGGLGKEAVGVKGGTGDPQDFRLAGGGLATFGHDLRVHLLELNPVHQLVGQQVGIAGGVYADPPQHLADHHLDVLVIDGHALVAVDRLDLLQQVPLGGVGPLDPEDVVGVLDPVGELLAGLNGVPRPDQPGVGGVDHMVPGLHLLRGDLYLPFLQVHPAGYPGHQGWLLFGALLFRPLLRD